ncbi:thiamine biosynthesis lipoprotein ApbE [Rhodovulum sulfidophilum]|uniref:hypothetical protein n=1 Tax=Rhodovulum sulfidophilum TaxID=35806 RepID=UPI0005A8C54C|nr:hypothetical protein [Rhodovulum sulfidophilum]ANB32728.1 hypothetical protein A6W98_00720 [Rhodovulum sulfidophilum DSM 1374]ANB36577.1 hypothetical protein A6024_00705 [Rhodovulum sulfidophilum]MCW2303278.1 thiamine biosynthesis lipoprotein ApbE [Rhodovulum sulfidophilum]
MVLAVPVAGVEAEMSVRRPDSDLMWLNQARGGIRGDRPAGLVMVLRTGLALDPANRRARKHGALALDLSGIAKCMASTVWPKWRTASGPKTRFRLLRPGRWRARSVSGIGSISAGGGA